MRYTNYDIIETESGDIFLYLSSQYYKLTGDPKMESFARKNINKGFGTHKKTGDLREWICEATTGKPPLDIEAIMDMKEVLDAADVPEDGRWVADKVEVGSYVGTGFKPTKIILKDGT